MKLIGAFVGMVVVGALFQSCTGAQTKIEPTPAPDVRVDLSAHGLPNGFFQPDSETRCAGQIIGYRFVVWLSNESVAVGFNTSPNCRQFPDRKVKGSARVLVFDIRGSLKATRDLPYEADGDGILVAKGEGRPGPGGTLLFRVQELHESKSGITLLDANLKDTAHLDRFLEQTTFVDHALVFQEGYTLGSLRTYTILNGSPLVEAKRWEQEWPTGTRDRKFGEHGVAFMLCQQELRPNEYVSTEIVYAGARQRCTMIAEANDGTAWTVPLRDGDTAEILGILADGSVAGKVNAKGNNGQLVIWKPDQTTEVLPWIPQNCGSFRSATANMSRYAVFTTCEDSIDNGRWIVFDRRSQSPIVNRVFPKNGRSALSPDGMRYASFESGELRIYSLPQLE